MLSNWLILLQEDRVWGHSATQHRLSEQYRPTQSLARVSFLSEAGNQIEAYLLEPSASCPAELQALPLRELLPEISADAFNLLAKARQLLLFEQQYRFCHHCGGQLHRCETETLAKQCNRCDAVHYPRIDPCVIVAVAKGQQILLASPHRLQGKLYSVVAGFVEPGETLEQTLVRELAEETGIRVKNLRYFGSQPWPFERNLMVGFIAEWADGEVNHDPEELLHAGWFSFDALPNIAPPGTIARQMIEYLRKKARP